MVVSPTEVLHRDRDGARSLPAGNDGGEIFIKFLQGQIGSALICTCIIHSEVWKENALIYHCHDNRGCGTPTPTPV